MRGRCASSSHSHLNVAHNATLRPTYGRKPEPLPLGFQPEAVDVLVDGGIELVRGL